MKKIKKSKEELAEIKKNKSEAKNNIFKKSKEKLTREQILLIGAIVLLVILVVLLILMLIFNRPQKLIVPDAPSYKQLDIGVVNFSDAGTDPNDLNIKKQSSLEVNYEIVSDYYKKGILLSNTQAEYLNDSFVITSGPLSSDPFISVIQKNGKMSFLTKLSKAEFGKFEVYKTIYLKDNYYVVGVSDNGNKKSLMIAKVNNDGKIITNRMLVDKFDGKIKDVISSKETIAIITGDSNTIEVYFTNTDLVENKKVVKLADELKTNEHLFYESSMIKDNEIKIAFKTHTTQYIATVNIFNYSTKIDEFTAVNDLNSNDVIISGYLRGYVANDTNAVYKLNDNNELINKFNYKNLKLEDEKAIKDKYKDDEAFDLEGLQNEARVDTVSVDNDSVIATVNTSFSTIYDVFDSNLKLTKRITIDRLKYNYDNGVLLKSFYVGGTIYEIYSYGYETPSIMIAKIG